MIEIPPVASWHPSRSEDVMMNVAITRLPREPRRGNKGAAEAISSIAWYLVITGRSRFGNVAAATVYTRGMLVLM